MLPIEQSIVVYDELITTNNYFNNTTECGYNNNQSSLLYNKINVIRKKLMAQLVSLWTMMIVSLRLRHQLQQNRLCPILETWSRARWRTSWSLQFISRPYHFVIIRLVTVSCGKGLFRLSVRIPRMYASSRVSLTWSQISGMRYLLPAAVHIGISLIMKMIVLGTSARSSSTPWLNDKTKRFKMLNEVPSVGVINLADVGRN